MTFHPVEGNSSYLLSPESCFKHQVEIHRQLRITYIYLLLKETQGHPSHPSIQQSPSVLVWYVASKPKDHFGNVWLQGKYLFIYFFSRICILGFSFWLAEWDAEQSLVQDDDTTLLLFWIPCLALALEDRVIACAWVSYLWVLLKARPNAVWAFTLCSSY